MYTVRYECGGRLGNCVFPYTLCVIYEMFFGKKYVIEPQPDEFVITDELFKTIYSEESFKNFEFIVPQRNICFKGYFQYDYIFYVFKDKIVNYIKSHTHEILSPSNGIQFYNTVLYHDYMPDFILNDNDIVFHVRLEDALYPDRATTPLLLQIHHYKSVIENFRKQFQLLPGTGKIYWILNKPSMPLEVLHLEFLLSELGGIYEPHSIEEDLCIMRKSKNLICSHSTFSWIAAAFSTSPQNVFIPEFSTILNYPHEKFTYLHEKSVVYPYPRYTSGELENDLLEWKKSHINTLPQ